MEKRKLGPVEVSAIGLGCMGMTGLGGAEGVYGRPDRAEALATIDRALELGITLLDTAELYGPRINEELVGEAIAGRRDRVVISTKFGFRYEGNRPAGTDSRPESIRRALEGSLKRLGTDHVDIYFQHRVDRTVPIEEVVGTMADLKRAGKIRAIGLSEAGPDTIRRAHATHPVDVLQSEWSLWERTLEDGIVPVCRELGIALMPFSPLGRGFLSGKVSRAEEYPQGDWRHTDPRYQGANFDANMRLVAVAEAVGRRHGASPAQVAIAWLLHQGPDVVPIPGAKRRATLEDTARAADVRLSAADMAELGAASAPGTTAGDRYATAAQMASVRI